MWDWEPQAGIPKGNPGAARSYLQKAGMFLCSGHPRVSHRSEVLSIAHPAHPPGMLPPQPCRFWLPRGVCCQYPVCHFISGPSFEEENGPKDLPWDVTGSVANSGLWKLSRTAGSRGSSRPRRGQAAILQPVCRGRVCCSWPFPAPCWELLRLLRVIPLSGKWRLCSSGSLAGGSPRPITGTSLCPKPPCHGPSTASRSAKRDCSYQIGSTSCPCGYRHAGRLG